MFFYLQNSVASWKKFLDECWVKEKLTIILKLKKIK
jgi:hypothetical protein